MLHQLSPRNIPEEDEYLYLEILHTVKSSAWQRQINNHSENYKAFLYLFIAILSDLGLSVN
jgi:hypothetical protein